MKVDMTKEAEKVLHEMAERSPIDVAKIINWLEAHDPPCDAHRAQALKDKSRIAEPILAIVNNIYEIYRIKLDSNWILLVANPISDELILVNAYKNVKEDGLSVEMIATDAMRRLGVSVTSLEVKGKI